ncbi:hypothetical protein PHK61_25995 [Actinomycetospora lutea]|uniref:hypothetical protein n=1 Tax=Actinomycetospora lutea TaxID=663604 RepID=UPI00236724F7|nr:hypothetical protein [Actinomycetospora lutea]MDD7941872.1 hypothetical protein [Actinomycetospora lutea]
MSTDDDKTPFALDVFADSFNGLVSKATEAVILMHTGNPELAATMGGGAGGATKGFIVGGERLWRQRRMKLAAAAEAAQREASGMTVDGLIEHALNQDDERRLDLLLRAFRRAAHDVDEERDRFYGRIAAAGVLEADDARVDAQTRVFHTVAHLAIADLRALVLMAERPEVASWHRALSHQPGYGEDTRVLDEEFPALAPMLDSIMATLDGQGLSSHGKASAGWGRTTE